MSLGKIFNDSANAHQNSVAVQYFENEHSSREITYRELQKESCQVFEACEYQRRKSSEQSSTKASVSTENQSVISHYLSSNSPSQSVLSVDTPKVPCGMKMQLNSVTTHDVCCKTQDNYSNCIVGVMCEPGLCSVACMLGIMQKYIYFFISPDWKESEIQSYLWRINPNIIIIEKSFVTKIPSLSSGTGKKILLFGTEFVCCTFSTTTVHPQKCEYGKIAYIMLTSGSTGTPKVVYVPHKCIIPNIDDFSSLFRVTSEDHILCASPPTFDPSMIDIFVGFQAGATLVMAHNWIFKIPKALLSVLTKSKVTILQATPSLLFSLGKQRIKFYLLGNDSCLKILALGGEVFPKLSVLREWMSDNCKTRIFNVYGITEVSCWSSVTEVFVYQEVLQELDSYNSNDEALVAEKGEPSFNSLILPKLELNKVSTLTSIGNPLSLTVIKVLNELGKEVVENEEGEIYIGGYERICWVDENSLESRNEVQTLGERKYNAVQVACSFNENTNYQEKITKQKPLIMRKTGDRGIVQKGKIYCLGRKDRQVKRLGKKVSLSEIERQCESFSYVENCHVVLHMEVKIIAFVKLDINSVCTASDILRDLKICMSDWRLPDCVITVDKFPINYHGKVDKCKLLKYFFRSKAENSMNNKFSDVEKFVKDLWKRILGLSSISEELNLTENENFIRSGGNSLFALQFAEEIESHYAVKIPTLVDLVLNGTLHEVLSVIVQNIKYNNDYTKIQKNKKVKLNLSLENIPTVNTPRLVSINYQDHDDVFKKRNGSLDRQVSVASRRGVYYSNRKEMYYHNQVAINFLWKYNLGKCIDSSPTLIEYPCGKTLVMVGSHSHKFICIDVHTGKNQWCLTLGGRIESSPCTSGDGRRVYVGCYDYNLYCINIITGEVLWKYAAKSEIKSSPVVDFETENVIFGSHDKNIYCLTSKGNLLWMLQLSVGSIFSSPCIVEEQVFVATLDGVLAGINKQTGNINWRVLLQKPIFSSITPYSKGIVLGSVGGEIYGFSVTGEKLWSFKTNGPVYSSAFTVKLDNKFEIIAIGSHDHSVIFFNSEGDKIAVYQGESAIYATPFICCLELKWGIRTLVCQTSGKYSLVDLTFTNLQNKSISGPEFTMPIVETVLECKTDGEIFSSPLIFRENLYICSRDDHIYCYKFV